MSVTLVDFACDASKALSKVSRTAADSDKGHVESPKLIDFATRIYTIAEGLEGRAVSDRRITQYLTDLERLCIDLDCSSDWETDIPADRFSKTLSSLEKQPKRS
ncbi:hypothetical protein LTR29_013353 [Friedmanniomyces endolithicus]|nr:hypothetical protein LTR29_013353 [Friedmanniomyces endolithicus]